MIETKFRDLTIPLVNNWQAQLITTAEDARRGLIEQIPNSVRWVESVTKLKECGMKRFVEVGPGSVLIGLCRNIDPALKGAKFCAPEDLEKLGALTA